MKHNVAEMIGRKAKALKHCDKVIQTIDKHGRTEILLGNTGIAIPCEKNDAIYTMLQSIRFKLVHEINSIEIVSRNRMLPAPNGACDEAPQTVCEMCGKTIENASGRRRFCADCARDRQRERCKRYAREKRAKE